MDWGEVLSVAVTGMLVVFLSLIILIVAVYIMGAFFSAGNAKKNKTNTKTSVESESKPVNTVSASANVVNETVDGVPGDVVAAITAAVACVLSSEGNTKPFTVKSIKPVRGARNPWNMAGIAENTRPF